jgi:hypothetical protein
MAIKRRKKDEEEDDDRRPRRRPKDDDDDDDPPPKRRKPRDEADHDDPSPKRRKSKDDDDGPPRRRKSSDKDDDKEDEPEEKKEKTYEEQMADFTRKKALRLKQLNNLSEGLMLFRKQIQLTMFGCGVCAAANVGMYVVVQMVFPPDFLTTAMSLPGLLSFAWVIAVAFFGFQAAKKCSQGPPKHAPNGQLRSIAVMSCLSVFLFIVTFIMETIYFRNVARYFKDKEQTKAAQSVLMQLIFVGFGGPIIVGGASYFLVNFMGNLGLILDGVLSLVLVLLYIKMFSELAEVTSCLTNTIARNIKIENSSEW